MSLTLRMRRALAAFRSNPKKPFISAGSEGHAMVLVSSNGITASEREMRKVIGGGAKNTPWHKHTEYHSSRILDGKRLNYFINARGQEKIQYGETMIYGAAAGRFLAKHGINRP